MTRPQGAPSFDPAIDDRRGDILKPYVPRLLTEWVRDSPRASYRSVEGSLAFADISGFTALTERLARRGAIGAELLRDTLDSLFGALLDEAYTWGAGLLKWGGDAMLLLFDGPDHPQRAARAAWEMQRTIDRVGRARVAGRPTTLRMSIGITSGTIDFFTAGSIHRELLVVGPIATETAVTETIAGAGEIAMSASTASYLDPGCVGQPKGSAFLLVAAPGVAEAPAADVGAVDADRMASCIPIAAREHVLLERSEPEHRTITAAFVDLMETDVLLAALGPARFGDALDERIRLIQEQALRFDVPFNVTDVSKGSVKVLLTAGAPSSTGHDEEQTLRCAREIMDRPGVIPMRMGISTGRAFTGHFGPPYRRTYAVLGDAVNTAARVMARAEAGQILSTQTVLERSRTRFAMQAIEPFQAKGKADLVEASLVGRLEGRTEERIAETPFVGRERELATLRAVLEDVKAGNGWTIALGGLSGIGKSRVVRELLDATGLRVLRADCEEYEASTPYYALRSPMRAVLGLNQSSSAAEVEGRLRIVVADAHPALVPWVPLLGILLGLDLAPTAETASIDERFLREVLAEITLGFLVSAAGNGPVAFVVEDAQFIDEASADLLHRLARTTASMPYAFLVVETSVFPTWTRTEDERQIAFSLLPISQREAAEIVDFTTAENPLRPHEVEELARRSGGSPLFLAELLNVMRSAGFGEAFPDSVEAVVTADIDRLSPSDRMVLRYASVLGVVFEHDVLREVLQDEVELDETVWERLQGLVDSDAAGRVRFRNTLVHDVAYAGLSFRRRRELHGRVGAVLQKQIGVESADQAAVLSLHFFHAGDLKRAWEYARMAADRAKRLYANAEAATLYVRALEATRRYRGAPADELAAAAEGLGDVRVVLGEFEAAADSYRRSRRHLSADPVEHARLMLKHALIHWRVGHYAQALRWLSRGIRLLEGRDDNAALRERADLYSWRAVVKQKQGHPHETIEWCRLAIDAAEESGAREPLARAYYMLDWSFAALGRFEEAVYSPRALEIYEELGALERQAIILNNLGVLAHRQGRWDAAVELYERAQQAWESVGDRWSASFATANRGELLLEQGRLDEAEPLMKDSLRIARATASGPRIADAAGYYGRLLARLGRFDEAEALLTEALHQHSLDGDHEEELETEARIAEALLFRGEAPEEALALAERTLDRARSYEGIFALIPTLQRVRGLALMELGRLAEASDALTEALARARDCAAEYEIALVLDALAALAGSRGGETTVIERERDEILGRLKVVRIPGVLPPLEDRSFASI
ncbi:MAG TPA: tetratricopeptide repeat protein [Gaiellaceae bacterium]|nr:tetratricopeptide repeat protein [Gaiellaceae bacterium]